MIFITFGKWRKKPTKEGITQANKLFEQFAKEYGGKVIAFYWTLGRYDTVCITEANDEKAIMKWGLHWGDLLSTETLVGVPREEAINFVE